MMGMTERNTEAAFHWITTILERHAIEYRICGGFAARAYGVTRELADIDFEIDKQDISKITQDVMPYIIFGPGRYQDESWDLELMTLQYEGQMIDIAGTGAKLFNQKTKQWEVCPGSLKAVEMKEVFGKLVPIEEIHSLINYKTKVGREVDVEDVKQLTAIINSKTKS